MTFQTQADIELTREQTLDAIRRNWRVIASHADVAANQPQHNMDAYIEISRDLERIKELIINAPVELFSDVLNKKGYSNE
jgi:hypothetical protein